jgi:signal transduction histidine kinase
MAERALSNGTVWIAAIAAFIASLVLFAVPGLEGLAPNGFASASVMALLGGGLLLSREGVSRPSAMLGRLLAALLCLAVAARVFGAAPISGPVQYLTAVFCVAASICLRDIKDWPFSVADIFAELTVAICALALGAHLVRFLPYIRDGQNQFLGAGTAAVLLLVALGSLALRPDASVFGVLTSNSAGALAMRTLLPVPFFLPFLLSLINSQAILHNLYTPRLGMWLFATANTFVFGCLVSLVAILLHRADERARSAQEQLKVANELLEERVQLRTEELKVEIAERVRAWEELNRSNTELEQFAYVASHDLQEPLRNVTTYAQLLGRKYRPILDGEGLEILATIENGANRMRRLVQDLLAYSRVLHEEPEYHAVNCADLLVGVLSDFRTAIEESGAVVEVGDMPVVKANRAHLEQVFHNLLSNALKYQAEGSVPRIVIGASEGEKSWVFQVGDNGIGIERQYQDRIFGLFKRLHRSAYPGTGLGLAVCKRAVQAHGGRIWVESKPGEGSTFFVELPKQMERAQAAGAYHGTNP